MPRIFEKAYNKILEKAKKGGLKQKIFEWAIGVGKAGSTVRPAGKEPGGYLGCFFGDVQVIGVGTS